MIGAHVVTVTPVIATYLASAAERTDPRFILTPCRTELQAHVGETVTVTLDLRTTNPTQIRVYPYQGTGISIATSATFNTTAAYQTFSFATTVEDWGGDIVTYTPGAIGMYDDAGVAGGVYVRNMTVTTAGKPPVDITCLADTVSINHGRDDPTGQPDASTVTVDMSWIDGVDVLPAVVEIGALLAVDTEFPPGSGTLFRRFAGRITDIEYEWTDTGEDTPNTLAGRIIGAGFMADLSRRVVGDTPWPQELDGARVSRILTLAGVPVNGFLSDPGTVRILPRDVDSQPALDVIRDTAASGGGILWEARDGRINYADAEHRRGTVAGLAIDACDILVTPKWSRTTAGLLNSVSLGYGVAPEGGGEQPRVIDKRQDSIDRYGRYEYTSATQLAALADAQAMVSLLLTRNVSPVWVFSELPLDMAGLDSTRTAAALTLDMHALVSVTGLPVAGSAPTTATLWVEGWSETLAAGVHELTIAVSGYCRTVPPPRWDDVNTGWLWDALSPSLTWDTMGCLGPPQGGNRWTDVPASSRWDNVPETVAWDQWG
jgi:hypothetical protein